MYHLLRSPHISELLGGATMIEGILMASEIAPESPHVHMRSQGIRNTVEFRTYTPDDVFTWEQQEADAWHFGSSVSMIELYDVVPQIEAGWESYKIANFITVQGCPSRGEFRYDKLPGKKVRLPAPPLTLPALQPS